MNTSSQTTNDFVLGNCPDCEGLVRVAAATKASAMVRCPRCGESFALAQMLVGEIPALEVVNDDIPLSAAGSNPSSPLAVTTGDDLDRYQPVTEQENGRFVIPSHLAKNAKRKKRRRRSSSSSKSSSAKASSPNPAAARAATSRSRSSSSTLSDDKTKRNPALEIGMIVLGAVMAIPIAQLLVWWFLGNDPIGLAPAVHKVIPVLVPQELAQEETTAAKEADNPGQ